VGQPEHGGRLHVQPSALRTPTTVEEANPDGDHGHNLAGVPVIAEERDKKMARHNRGDGYLHYLIEEKSPNIQGIISYYVKGFSAPVVLESASDLLYFLLPCNWPLKDFSPHKECHCVLWSSRGAIFAISFGNAPFSLWLRAREILLVGNSLSILREARRQWKIKWCDAVVQSSLSQSAFQWATAQF